MLNIEQALQLASEHHRAGRLGEAEQCCLGVLRLRPDDVGAIHLLGVLAYQTGRNDLAVECFRQTLLRSPSHAEAHSNLGMALARQGRLAEAISCYQTALQLKPEMAEAHCNLANAYQRLGQTEAAVAGYRVAVRIKPDYGEAHGNLGVTLLQQGFLSEAVTSLEEALRIKPNNAEAYSNLGVALLRVKRLEEAEDRLRRALDLKPNVAEFYGILGVALEQQGKLDEAETCFRQAVRLKPDYAGAYNDLGALLADQGRLTEAEACYRQALRLKPDYAEVHENLAYTLLVRGDFKSAWTEYPWRLLSRDSPALQFQRPLWDGSELEGKTLMLVADQGLGDAIQFVRYLPLLPRAGAKVFLHCHGSLVRLLTGLDGLDGVVPQGADPPPFDLQAPLLSLPQFCGTTLATIPAKVPYLAADPRLREAWHERLGAEKKFKVGIAWQGNPEHKRDRERSVPLSLFQPLAELPGVLLVSLQKGSGREQISALADRLNVLDPADDLSDFADTAALLCCLDLVITVDTSVAHLAGALGIPVWVAVSLVPEWRWLLERDDSPWYPTMRLFRQTTRGDWGGVFERLAKSLRQEVEAALGERDAVRNPGPSS
jgi:tetratricopeptide (TPR) repeat protein